MRSRRKAVPSEAEAADLRRRGEALEQKIENLEEGSEAYERAMMHLDDIAERLHRYEQQKENKGNTYNERPPKTDGLSSVQRQVLEQITA